MKTMLGVLVAFFVGGVAGYWSAMQGREPYEVTITSYQGIPMIVKHDRKSGEMWYSSAGNDFRLIKTYAPSFNPDAYLQSELPDGYVLVDPVLRLR